MSPVDLTRARREELQREIDANRRWELRLPIYGRAESLNLATAASVCLYESAFAQRA